MKIQIDFKNDNQSADRINVYRSDTKFSKLNLPAVYETIAGTAASYIDNNAPADKTQYYMFGIVKGTYEVFSICIEASSLQFTGPGPQTLLKGDLECGYFGTIVSADFTTYGTYLDLCGIATGSRVVITQERWMKFAHRGKILFIPEKPMLGGATWQNVYNAGLVYGVDGPGPRDLNTYPAVNQMKMVSIRNYQFICRLPTSVPDTVNAATVDITNRAALPINNYSIAHPMTAASNAVLTGSEWDDLITKTCIWANPNERGSKFDTKVAELTSDANSNWNGHVDNLFQNLRNSSTYLTRGSQSAPNIFTPGQIRVNSTTGGHWYRPVLELVR